MLTVTGTALQLHIGDPWLAARYHPDLADTGHAPERRDQSVLFCHHGSTHDNTIIPLNVFPDELIPDKMSPMQDQSTAAELLHL